MILKTIDGIEFICIPLDDIRALKGQRRRFEPPTLDEVRKYCKERNKGVDPVKWWNFYNSKGWMIGKNKMVQWKSAMATWEKDESAIKFEAGQGRKEIHDIPKDYGIRSDTAVEMPESLRKRFDNIGS